MFEQLVSDLKLHIEKVSYLEKDLKKYKNIFGAVGEENDLAKQVKIREQELKSFITKYEGLEMV